MAEVSSLWVGSPLSLAHKIALSSFVYHGHSIKLYVYDMGLEVPTGVVKVDANTIVPESEIFTYYGKLAPFADYFRYLMVAKTNEMWVDVDTISLSEYFFEDKEYVFIEEMPNFYAQGILKMPYDSNLCKFLNQEAKDRMSSMDKNNTFSMDSWGPADSKSWISLGPGLLTEAVNNFGLEEHGQPAVLVNGLDLSVSQEDPYELFWIPENRDLMLKRLESSLSATFFNSSLDFRGLKECKDTIPSGSLIEYFYNKFFVQ